MRAAILLVGLCSLAASPAVAQERLPRISGVVVDSTSGAVVGNALVLLEGHGQVFTSSDGRYAFPSAPPPGEYLLAAVTRDCRIAAVRLTLDGLDPRRLDLSIGLQHLQEPDAAYAQETSFGTGVRVTTREEIERLGEGNLPAILRRIAPSMVAANASSPGAAVQLRERGVSTVTGSRAPLILLDDVRVVDTRLLDVVDVDQISRIEVAPGATGGWAWGLEGASGVVIIRTREGDLARNPYCGAASRIR
jgi:hypothetical protein